MFDIAQKVLVLPRQKTKCNKTIVYKIMELAMILLFVCGYAAIALEHQIHINKAASALILSSVLWTLYMFHSHSMIQEGANIAKTVEYVLNHEIIEGVGDVAEVLFFLMGAMTIVELIDVHGGFEIITSRIQTKSKKKLLYILSLITFFMSAILDNLTTTIVIVMLLRKLIADKKERWLFASVVVLAANAGGAFSPIGDVTTIMLWVKGNVTTEALLPQLFIPSLLAAFVPVLIVGTQLKGNLEAVKVEETNRKRTAADVITSTEQKTIFYLGVGALIFVPIFKSLTHLPPFFGVLLGLGVLWVYTEILYHGKHDVEEEAKGTINRVVSRIDFTTILFFLGILMAVNALACADILKELSNWLDKAVGDVYIINLIIGVLSSIVDNVPLVQGAMKMYELAPDAASAYACDGVFWLFLAYCAGVGGSILIIGSAAGVVVMGLEKVTFGWYLQKISVLALIGYLAGAGWFVLQELVIRPALGF